MDETEGVIDVVDEMEMVRGCWLGFLRRGKGVDYKEAKGVKEAGEKGYVNVEFGNGEFGKGQDNSREEKGTRKEDLWMAQQKYENEIARLADEARVVIWRLLARDEPEKVVEEKKDGEGREGKVGSYDIVKETKSEDAEFFGHIDKFIEENMDDMDPKLIR